MDPCGGGLAQECIARWVKNCSDHILSHPELSVLKKGLNFVVTPKRLAVVDLVTVMESACRQLGGVDANELRAKVVNILGRGERYWRRFITSLVRKGRP